jgi:hypothetical protein
MSALGPALLAYQTGSQYFGQRDQANAAVASGSYQRSAYNQNATLADAQAADALARGNEAASIERGNTEAATRVGLGSARAAAGGSGVAANSGSVVDTSSDFARQTGVNGALDALTLQNNAAREAWGFKVDAQQNRNAGDFAYRAGRNTAAALRAGATGTLLTGAAQAYQMGSDYMRNRPSSLSIPKAPVGGYNRFGK